MTHTPEAYVKMGLTKVSYNLVNTTKFIPSVLQNFALITTRALLADLYNSLANIK